MEKQSFGILPDGQEASLYTISCGQLQAQITDYGATLVRLYTPDRDGKLADVVLGFENADQYRNSATYFGATVGRNANRVGGACFMLGNKKVELPVNDNRNNLHSGPDSYAYRIWKVDAHTEDMLKFSLHSPDGDQGFPGNADITVTYTLDSQGALTITYDAVSDKDTVFNLTNHTYFNLAGHDKPEKAMGQILSMPARFFNAADAESIPTGELRSVEGTPMDFREPKPIGRDINDDYECLQLQGGYDHNFEVFCNPCAVLSDPESGRVMTVATDCPGMQLYAGNFLKGEQGKDGVSYTYRGGIALETQFYPNAVNNPNWPQPVVKAGEHYHSVTQYSFQ